MANSVNKVPKLKGSINYNIQSIRITSILIDKDVFNAIKNTESASKSSAKDVNKALALIRLSLEDRPLLQTRFISSAIELQDSLKNLYKSKGFSSKFILSKDLINNNLNLNKGNLETYLNSFKRINNSLIAKGIILPNKFLVALLLNNLNKDYKYIVAVIT